MKSYQKRSKKEQIYASADYKGKGKQQPDLIEKLPDIDLEILRKPKKYLASKDLAAAVNVALTLGMPLLLTGEPGSGKSGLAESLAWEIATHDDPNPQPLRFVVKSDTQARDLFYRFDTLGRFHASQTPDADSDPRQFISFEALGKAILHAKSPEYAHHVMGLPEQAVDHPGAPKRSVVLIDEIDKAPRDVPNDILVELERLEFDIPELHTAHQENKSTDGRISLARHENRFRPIVIITSNSEKALPDPFLRRCVYHHLEFPPFRQADGQQSENIVTVEDIVARRLGERYVNGGQVLVEQGIGLFRYFREEAGRLERRPTLAELLDWLNYLLPDTGEVGKPAESMLVLEEAPLITSIQHLLLKKPADQARATELWQAWRNKQTQSQ